ncbi:MAG TPA: hypothetical protein VNZ22_10070, partial [Bacillota bacterium]|nr:hypothetical protein [Bacillota bacterium]
QVQFAKTLLKRAHPSVAPVALAHGWSAGLQQPSLFPAGWGCELEKLREERKIYKKINLDVAA